MVKAIVFAGFAIIFVILILDLTDFTVGGKERSPGTEMVIAGAAENYSDALESRLEELLSGIEGVGQVKVMLTLENLEETVYAEKAQVTVRLPKVRGAAVVCTGGGNPVVKEKVVEAVSRSLGISTARVSVTR